MANSIQYTFILCQSGAAPWSVKEEDRQRIRGQVMRTSWPQKEKKKGERNYTQYAPASQAPRKLLSQAFRAERQCCASSASRSAVNLEMGKSDARRDVANSDCSSQSLDTEVLVMKEPESPCRSIEDDHGSEWIDEEASGLQMSSPSGYGVDPFTSSVAPIDFRMHSYLQYYLNHILPILHPFQEQTAVLKNTLLTQLNQSPLVLYSILTIAALRIDNYCNKYDELLLYTKWTDSRLPVPHSFRFKNKTVQLLLHTMRNPESEPVSHMVLALICLITYELLVENIEDARTHFRGLRKLLRAHGGLQKICAASVKSSTITEMRKVVRQMERYAEHCNDSNTQQRLTCKSDEEALSHRLAMYSQFPTLIDKALRAPIRADCFASERRNAAITDEMIATECFWHMGCRNEKRLVLNTLIGTETRVKSSASNMCEHDRSCYSVVHGLDKIPGWNKSRFEITGHTLPVIYGDRG